MQPSRIRSLRKALGGCYLAFNTVGWEGQNILFNTIDAIIGTDIGTEAPAKTHAYLENTDVHSAGGVRLNALSDADINAEIGNSTTTR